MSHSHGINFSLIRALTVMDFKDLCISTVKHGKNQSNCSLLLVISRIKLKG